MVGNELCKFAVLGWSLPVGLTTSSPALTSIHPQVSDWWEEYIYLRGRSPLMVNSNYYVMVRTRATQFWSKALGQPKDLTEVPMGEWGL